MKRFLILTSIFTFSVIKIYAQECVDKFAQLYDKLPTPNTYRTATGTPGPDYYQQQADYIIDIKLNEEKRHIDGYEQITYTNNSKQTLTYLWLQLDQNLFADSSDHYSIREQKLDKNINARNWTWIYETFGGGFNIEKVTMAGKPLAYAINGTMMRIDLPKPLLPNSKVKFDIKWNFKVVEHRRWGGRSGYEAFPDGNDVYTVAQFYPRMCTFDDIEGWQNKAFLGRGEFSVEFGNYQLTLDVPADYICGATGQLTNQQQVLTANQQSRFAQAQKNDKNPTIIVTQAEAEKAEKTKSTHRKKWIFKAENVRDVAFCASRKFIWDAMAVKLGNRTVMAMSFYPKEGNPLWEKYSTRAVAHTIKVYSDFTFDYPYPVAQSVHAEGLGMEYPMMCFNFGRPNPDGSYSHSTKYRMLGVIIHEVGHNFFPMIVNTDERQWTWLDEGLNTFLQYQAEQRWEPNFPSYRYEPAEIAPYMAGETGKVEPIMTNSESISQFGYNAYGKPCAALNVLRETVLGPQKFDYAFKHYAKTWMFKRPQPADFFRCMEEASGTDLDWFFRGWFFTTDYVDIAISNVELFENVKQSEQTELGSAEKSNPYGKPYVARIRNQSRIKTLLETDTAIADIYNAPPLPAPLPDTSEFYYQLTFKNLGGLVMPLIVKLDYANGTSEVKRFPAEVWLKDCRTAHKLFVTKQRVVQFTLDPYLETADADATNNYFPQKYLPSRFKLFKGEK